MDAFSIVLIVGSIIFLIVYYYRQYKEWKKEQSGITWPRVYNQCPDYWVSEGKGICKNQFNIGKCPSGPGGVQPQGIVDFTKVVGGISSDASNKEVFNQ